MESNQNNPASKDQAPDPARSYERADPKAESGMGSLNTPPPAPRNDPDHMPDAVANRQPPEPDQSMLEEEPRGEDLTPLDIHDPRRKRHPRTEGKGGTP